MRLLVRTALSCGLVGLLVIGFCYLEPVKAARLYRRARGWTNSLRADDVHRKADVLPYEPVVLTGSYPEEKLEGAGARRALRLMDLDYDADATSSSQKVSVYLDGQRRHAIAGTPPFRFSYHLRVPDGGELRLGINQEVVGSYGGELFSEVLVSSSAGTKDVYRTRLSANSTGWKDAAIDLGAFSGQDVTLQFRTSLEKSASAAAGSAAKSMTAYWSTLLLRSRAEAARKPNVFLILIDTLRPDHLGSYGYGRSTSPNIDELAEGGVRFERAYSAAPWTNPSILALFTGRYPSDAWEPAEHRQAIKLVVPPSLDTIAEIFSSNGYLTVAASDHPGINYELFGRGFDVYLHLFHVDGRYTEWRETDSDKVLEQLHDLLEGQPDRGLFTYIHLIYPHQPYEPPPPYDDYFGRGTLWIRRRNTASVINMYDGDIRHTDDVIKDVVADIGALGLGRESITVLLSDHGEGFWEHGLWEHGNSLYNELLHVPLIFHAPGRIPEHKTVRELVRSVDILPTILDLVGIAYDQKNFRGKSLLPLMRNGEAGERVAFSEFPHSRIVFGRAIQSSTEKLIDPGRDGRAPEYYDVVEDTHERHDLGASRSSQVSDLLRTMNDISRAASQSRLAHPPQREEPSADTIRKLKSLGYTQ